MRDVNVGNLLGELFSLIGGSIRPCALFVLVVGVVGGIGGVTELGAPPASELGFGGGLAVLFYALLIIVVTVIASYMLTAELLRSRGRLAAGGVRIFSFIGLSLLTALGAGFGMILLLVPGVILLVRWSAAPAFLVGRREGVIEALSSSWNATKGHGWAIFFAGLIVFIATLMFTGVSAGMGASAVFTGGALWIVTQIVSALVGAVGNVITIAFPVAVYLLIHDDQAELDRVFA